MASILVTGIAGGLAQQVARQLVNDGHAVTGVDYRTVYARLPEGVKMVRASYNKTGIEDVLKHGRFDTVLHLGRVGNLREDASLRFDMNVVGTQKIMNLCVAEKVKRLIVLSTFHIYGAHPANHTPISEDDPLRAGLKFPQIADAIQLDNMASTWVYRHPEVCTSVLRPTNVIGPNISNTMSIFLRNKKVPYLMGFNPMSQFIHETDLAHAIVTAAQQSKRGVYNLAGKGVIPWRTALELAQADTYGLPGFLVDAYLMLRPGFPRYLVNFFRYPCVISDAAFQNDFGWTPRISDEEALITCVAEARQLQRQAHPTL